MSLTNLRHGIFLPPFHPNEENPTQCLERDLELMTWLDKLGFHEAWIGEHHSAGFDQEGISALRDMTVVIDLAGSVLARRQAYSGTDGLRMPEACRTVHTRLEGESGQRPYAGNRHEEPTYLIFLDAI